MDLKEYLITEFVGDYLERHLTRREALQRLAAVTGSMAMAASILAACGPQAPAPQATAAAPASTAVPPTAAASTPNAPASDASIQAQDVQFPGLGGVTLMAHLARPQGNGPFYAVLVCHENRGLTEHIKDVTRRVAKAGYVGLGVDLLSRLGGTEKADPGQIAGALGNANEAQMVGDFISGWEYLKTQPFVRKEGVGMVGFCFGGGMTWRVATALPDLKAAVPFYGPGPDDLAEVANIRAAMLGIYGETDRFINPGIPALEAELAKHNKTFEKIIYPGAGHAFYNDTGRSYHAEAASDAWTKTLAWFDRYLKT